MVMLGHPAWDLAYFDAFVAQEYDDDNTADAMTKAWVLFWLDPKVCTLYVFKYSKKVFPTPNTASVLYASHADMTLSFRQTP